MAFDLAAAIADGVGVSEKALTVPNVRVWPVSEINFYPGVMLTAGRFCSSPVRVRTPRFDLIATFVRSNYMSEPYWFSIQDAGLCSRRGLCFRAQIRSHRDALPPGRF